MIVALIDNGSLEPASHRMLRVAAAALSARVGVAVHAVSWRHSDRIPAAELTVASASGAAAAGRAWTLLPFMRAQLAAGAREFVFVPFFVSAQGAIVSAVRRDLERLQSAPGGFRHEFADGLAERGALVPIVAARIRETLAARRLQRPAVIVVDHGGPSAASARLRNQVAAEVRAVLGGDIGPLAPASMEGAGHAHNRPLLAEQLAAPGFDAGDVVIAPLFLSAGRHAGPAGDLARIVAEGGAPAFDPGKPAPALPPERHSHFTGLIGDHPLALDALSTALADTLSSHLSPAGDPATRPT